MNETSETTELAAVDVAMEELEVLLADANREAQVETNWLAPWYLRKMAELEAAESLIKEQSKRMLAQVAARRKALEYQWGQAFKAQVDADLAEQGGKKKSIDYMTGRAGYRSSGGKPQIVIEDENAAIEAAEMACPDAIKRTIIKSVLQAYVESTGEEIPGTKLITTPKVEHFYPALTYMALTKEGDNVSQSE
ncbi:MAG: hypothetical protein GXY83_15525 [Rhodopirellula sp.]|nr:hypothetical protein [Rhodopirellula sp.]